MTAPAIVVDTNVLVAAGFSPGSASARIVGAVARGELRMAWNDATRDEIEHVLGRIPPLRRRAASPLFEPSARVTAAMELERFADIVDPDDRKFAALAHAAGAVLVSSDRHLLAARGRDDLAVMTPGEFWRHHGRDREDLGAGSGERGA